MESIYVRLEPWWELCEEDEAKWDRVFWYCGAKLRNQIRKRRRAEMEAAPSQDSVAFSCPFFL